MNILVPAAGEGERWGGHLDGPKHLAPVGGRPVIHDVVARFAPHGSVTVVGPYRIDGAATADPRLDPARGDIDKICSSRHLWNADGRTLVVFGDVWFTGHAVAVIVGDVRRDWQVYGRPSGSKRTGKRFNENFALSFYPEHHDHMDRALAETVALAAHGKRNRLSQFYRIAEGWKPEPWGRTGAHFTVIDDLTDDFDTPAEYRRLLKARTPRSVAVVVPFRSDEPSRLRAWQWVRDHYATHHPDWELVVADDGSAEFDKPAALNATIARLDHDVLVVADADSFVDPARLEQAVDEAETAPWVMVHSVTERLTAEATDALYAGEPTWEAIRPYQACPGGGIFVMRRTQWDRVGGMDETFGMWGGEDHAFGLAADTLLGRHLQLGGPLWHLWHEPMARRQTSRWRTNFTRVARYKQASLSPTRMASLVGVDNWKVEGMATFVNKRNPHLDPVTVPDGSRSCERLQRLTNIWERLDDEQPASEPAAAELDVGGPDGNVEVDELHTGGGWYQLPDGTKVRGRDAAEARLAEAG